MQVDIEALLNILLTVETIRDCLVELLDVLHYVGEELRAADPPLQLGE